MKSSYKIHSVKYNFVMNVILKMSSVIFPLITFPYVSRILGVTGNGRVAFATSVIYYFTIIATLGIPTYGVKICAKYRDDKKKLSKVVKELLTISTIMMIISYFIFFLALYFIPKFREEKTLLIINSAIIFLTVFGIEWFYQGIEQYDYITLRNLVFKIISIVLMFMLIHKSEDYILYGLITVIGSAGSNILNIIRVHKYVDLREKTSLNISKHIRPIFTLFMLTAATMIYTSLDSVMLGFISTDTQVGYYNAATKIKGVLVSLVTALGTVLLPRLSYFLANDLYESFLNLIRKSFNFVFLISFPLTIFCIIQASNCVLLLAGEGYALAVLPMQIIMPCIIFIGFSNIIGVQILIPFGLEKLTVISTLIGAIVNIVFNAFLIPLFLSSGAAFGTLVAEFVVLCIQIYVIKDKIMSMIDLNNLIKIFVSGIVSSIGLVSINYFAMKIINSTFINLLITGIVFFITYFFILLVFKETLIFDFIKKVKVKVNKQ